MAGEIKPGLSGIPQSGRVSGPMPPVRRQTAPNADQPKVTRDHNATKPLAERNWADVEAKRLATAELKQIGAEAETPKGQAGGLAARLSAAMNAINQLLPAASTSFDTAANATDIAVSLEEAAALAGTTVSARMAKVSEVSFKVGKGLGVVAMGIAAKDFVGACNPIAIDGMLDAMANFAIGISAFAESLPDGGVSTLGKIGGVGCIVGAIIGGMETLKDYKENGGNVSNVLGVVAYTSQLFAGVAMLVPGMQPMAAALTIAAGGGYLAQMAADNSEYIKEKGSQAVNAVGNFLVPQGFRWFKA